MVGKCNAPVFCSQSAINSTCFLLRKHEVEKCIFGVVLFVYFLVIVVISK